MWSQHIHLHISAACGIQTGYSKELFFTEGRSSVYACGLGTFVVIRNCFNSNRKTLSNRDYVTSSAKQPVSLCVGEGTSNTHFRKNCSTCKKLIQAFRSSRPMGRHGQHRVNRRAIVQVWDILQYVCEKPTLSMGVWLETVLVSYRPRSLVPSLWERVPTYGQTLVEVR